MELFAGRGVFRDSPKARVVHLTERYHYQQALQIPPGYSGTSRDPAQELDLTAVVPAWVRRG